MRRRMAAVVVAAVAVLLVGCSPSAPESPGAAPGAPGAFPVSVPTAFGDVTFPEAPQRVVALGWSDAETALALGVEPVGAADWLAVGGDGLGPWVTARYTTPPEILGTLEVDLERVAALEPDLILDTRASGERPRYDRLAQLGVPVVSIPAGGENYATAWDEQLRLVGAALGRTAEADRLVADVESRFAAVREQNPALAGATFVSGARSTNGEYGAYVGADGRPGFLTDLGMVNSPAIVALDTGGFSVPISRERLGLLDARVTIMQAIGGDASAVTTDPLWQAVPSVAAGRGIVLDDEVLSNAFSASSAPGRVYALDRIVAPIAAAVARP